MITPREIYKVFYTTPRDGYKSGNIWIQREEEDILEKLLNAVGVSICIDGPTGTGKSSLAITILKKKNFRFLLIQVTKNMKWKDFCKKLFEAKINYNNGVDIGIDAGFEKGLPIFKIHFGIKTENNQLKDLEYEEKIIQNMTDHEICKILQERDLTLVIDDFERASEEILSNIGEMCKLITLSYISNTSKIIIIGTDDIYHRLVRFNKSLEARLKEISIGTLEKKQKSWNFLVEGFNKLQLKHPQQEFEKHYVSVSKQELNELKSACYDAADGLLKSLNELGSEIALKASSQNRISKATILEVCKYYLDKNIKHFNVDFPQISKLIQNNIFVKDIVICLYKKGIGQIHRWDEIVESFDESIDLSQIENAICELVEINFLTRTGYNGEILFVSNPTMAHIIGTFMSNPNKYKMPKSLMFNHQYVLPFLKKQDDSESN